MFAEGTSMNRKPSYAQTCLLMSACLFFVGSSIFAGQPDNEKDLQTALANNYVAAKQSKNTAQLIALLHPKVRACMTDANREYFDYLFTNDLKTFSAGKISKISITSNAADSTPLVQAFFPAELFPYPARPTHNIQVDFEEVVQSDAYGSVTAIMEIAEDHGGWYWVTACPTAKGVEFVKQQQEEGLRQKARARQLASEIKEPLLSQIKALLSAGDRVKAIQKYQSATNSDMSTAVTVIDALGSPQP
jgi:hypothetical protein